MSSSFTFNIHSGDKSQEMTERELAQFASLIGLDGIAPGRYTWFFVFQIFLHLKVHGINPAMIVEEVKALEGHPACVRTKPASEFRKEPLKGLWHKHFFSARFIAKNIQNQLSGGRLREIIDEVLDPETDSSVTEQMTNELSRRVVSETFEDREAEGKLTGEWIVFAKHEGKNYYLTVSTHNAGDDMIYEQIKSICFRQFPFLAAAADN